MKFERVVSSPMLEKIEELARRCFDVSDFDNLVKNPDDFGGIYALSNNGTLIGYAVYGQVWLPIAHEAYITQIGVYPHYRQQGWGLKMLNRIVTELSTRPDCPAVHADIRQSNIASQRLFQKAGFYVYCERDEPYGDEVGIRVIRTLRKGD